MPKHRPFNLLPSLALLSVSAFCVGCASISIQRLEPPDPHRRPASQVVVLKELPSVPYRGIARIEVRDRGLGASAADLRKKLIAAAAQVGANAVVLEPTSTRRSLGVTPGGIGLYDDLVVSGLAIIQQSASSAVHPEGPATAAELTPNPSLPRAWVPAGMGARRIVKGWLK